MGNSPKIGESGITLLEVLVAMIILSLALLVLMQMAMVALDGNDWANKTTRATQLIQDKLEQLRGEPNPASGVDTVDAVVRTWTVSSVNGYLLQVNVSADWEDINAIQRNYALSSFIHKDSV